MKSPTVVHARRFLDNPSNPAKCYVKKGLIVINDEAFQFYPDYAKRFIVEHEKGHYYLQTFDEKKADAYALGQLALKEKNSLFNALKSVRLIARSDPEREQQLATKALIIAAEHGSMKARELLGSPANATGKRFVERTNSSVYLMIGVVVVISLLIFIHE